jgi:hypothetical protein
MPAAHARRAVDYLHGLQPQAAIEVGGASARSRSLGLRGSLQSCVIADLDDQLLWLPVPVGDHPARGLAVPALHAQLPRR